MDRKSRQVARSCGPRAIHAFRCAPRSSGSRRSPGFSKAGSGVLRSRGQLGIAAGVKLRICLLKSGWHPRGQLPSGQGNQPGEDAAGRPCLSAAPASGSARGHGMDASSASSRRGWQDGRLRYVASHERHQRTGVDVVAARSRCGRWHGRGPRRRQRAATAQLLEPEFQVNSAPLTIRAALLWRRTVPATSSWSDECQPGRFGRRCLRTAVRQFGQARRDRVSGQHLLREQPAR